MYLNNKSKAVAYGGLLTALSVIFIYLSTIVPYNKLLFLFFSTLIIPIGLILTNVKNSLYIYIASSVLSLLLLGMRGNVLSYILFFGPYGIIKNFIEKIDNLFIEIILKLIYFNITSFVLYKLYGLFIANPINGNISIKKLIIFIQPVFLLFDYFLTLYIHKLKKYRI
ncbi:MAG: hypothetical protein KZY61_11180 [Clostridiaceae bacterium]|nr:hypothetical protein [Clostridiaceae bacterium]MBW4860219.1 hypothetical protein [Clostridiaceae bacterium]MBW4869196.1 hypothetical protein [Clostridiaceae bacterium]